MNLVRRLSATFTSTVDRAISRVENHDAIIHAALRDAELGAAKARVRLERLRKDGAGLRSRHAALVAAEQRWQERAKQLASSDEARALECLRRRRDCETQLGNLALAIESHDELERRIAEQVRNIESRIGEIAEQRNRMRSRESVADAMRAIRSIEGPGIMDIEEAFDRWEVRLGANEYLFAGERAPDPLDAGLGAEEETRELRAELATLVDAGTGAGS